MERIVGFDIARGIAVTLVVLLHATLLPQSGVDLSQPVCRMALLLLISGAVAAPALTRDWAYSRNRALDLVWLFAVWTPIVLLALKGPAGLKSIPRELVDPTTHLWFIGGLALLVLSVPALRNIPPAAPLALSGAAAVWHLTGHRIGASAYDQMLHFTVFFYAGLYGRCHLLALLARCGQRVGWAAVIALTAMQMLPLPHSAATMGSAAALLFVAQGLARSPAAPVLARLGRRTPDIYLAHVPILLMAGRMIGPMEAGALVSLTVATIAACLVGRHLAETAGLGWLYRRPQLTIFEHEVWPRLFAR